MVQSIDLPRDTAAALIAGLSETPVLATFLRRLGEQTAATRVAMLLRGGGCDVTGAPHHAALRSGLPEPDVSRLERLGLFPFTALRPRRIYALGELLSPGDAGLRARQHEALAELAIADMRCIRIPAPGGHEAWLALFSDSDAFAASAGSRLLAIEPAVSAALVILAELEQLRLRAAAAEAALVSLGIGLTLRDAQDRLLAEAGSPRRSGEGGATLVRPAPQIATALHASAHRLEVHRRGPQLDRTAAQQVLIGELGLSPREAELAAALAQGRGLVEAGAELGLTAETTRNYSKRIYAKTGAAGQADLVRLVLSGLAPLAGGR